MVVTNALTKIPVRWRVIAGLLVALVAYSVYSSLANDRRLRAIIQCYNLDVSDDAWEKMYPDTTKAEVARRCE